MGFNSAFKGLKLPLWTPYNLRKMTASLILRRSLSLSLSLSLFVPVPLSTVPVQFSLSHTQRLGASGSLSNGRSRLPGLWNLCFVWLFVITDLFISHNSCFSLFRNIQNSFSTYWFLYAVIKELSDHWIWQHACSSFQSFAVVWMLYAFFWVIPRRLNFICRRFGTLFVPSS
jgi:hypothetical protein